MENEQTTPTPLSNLPHHQKPHPHTPNNNLCHHNQKIQKPIKNQEQTGY